MSALATASSRVALAPPARSFRTDIQALRAIAIGLVVLSHLWPSSLPGGYVGVDVFFVISGYLITGHLLSELSERGSVRLGAFYARRIRRLLPAALLVLAVSAVLTLFLPYSRWEDNGWQILASAVYAQNWLLASTSVDYFALNEAASLVQHYWSLSVEEQFYIVWPVLLAVAASAALRGGRRYQARRRARTLIAGVLLLSLVASLLWTAVSPSSAYFVTVTRGWEFAAGGLVALASTRLAFSRLVANLLATAGLVAIAVSAVCFGPGTPFPGFAALLPVIGTAAVLAAGVVHDRLWHTPATSFGAVQWLGGISYSLYLWHWPLYVVAPFVLGTESSAWTSLLVLLASLALADLTKRFIEDRGRTWPLWRSSTPRALQGMVAGIVVIASLATLLVLGGRIQEAIRGAEPSPVGDACVGPEALDPDAGCAEPFRPAEDPVMSTRNEYFATPDECVPREDMLVFGETRTTHECDFSHGGAEAAQVWIVGDSHAQQWQSAIFGIAQERGWRVITSYYGGCPVADAEFAGFRLPWVPGDIEACRAWSAAVSDTIVTEAPAMVFTAAATREDLVADDSVVPASVQYADGLARTWTRWAEAGVHVFPLADPPLNAAVRGPDCVLINTDDPLACARPRAQAQPEDPVVMAAAQAGSARVGLIDLTDRFCGPSVCHAVVGGVPVYYDADHLNREYVALLRPFLEEAVDTTLSLNEAAPGGG